MDAGLKCLYLLLSACMVAQPAWAAKGRATCEPLGWSQDSRYFAYRFHRTSDCEESQGVIFDTTLLQQRSYLFEPRDPKRLCQHPYQVKQAEFEAWVKQHSLAIHEGPVSPAGRRADFEGKQARPQWQESRLLLRCGAEKCGRFSGKISEKAGRTSPIVPVEVDERAEEARWFWSPDEKRAVLLVSSSNDPVGDHAYLVVVSQPRVQVVADALLLFQDRNAVLESLAARGVMVSSAGVANTMRTQSEVFARPGFETQAEEIPKLLHGGARVAPLTWEAPADIVVALGSSVEAGKDPARFLDLPKDFPSGFSSLDELRWSSDSRFLMLKTTDHGCCGDPVNSQTTISVIDSASGEVACFAFTIEAGLPSWASDFEWIANSLPERFKSCSSRAAFEAWSAGRKWAEISPRWKPGTAGPAIHPEAQPANGQWKGDVFRWRPASSPLGDTGSLTLLPAHFKITVGEGLNASVANMRNAENACTAAQVVEPVYCDSSFTWAPDQSRVAWMMVSDIVWGMSGARHARLVVAPARGPLLRLVAHPSILSQVVRPVRLVLAEKGFLVASAGKADTDREHSVVYAVEGAEQVAKEVAGVVPGGATVEPLTWKDEAGIVIALGRSALP